MKETIVKIKPAFKDNNKCIVFSANNEFMPCLAVMIQSIIDNANTDKFYDILVLNKDIDLQTMKTVEMMTDFHDNIMVRFLNISQCIKGLNFFTANRKTITEEAYFRLLIPWILDEVYTSAVYLDGDMVVTTDIDKIFENDLSENYIAAVRDYWGICNCYMPNDPMREYRESIGLDNIDDYIISGTILFNLNQFRNNLALNEVLKLAVAKPWKQHDQDVINILTKGRISYLNPTWGFMSDYGNNKYLPKQLLDELDTVQEVPYIIHFGGVRKPWSRPFVEFYMTFWRYANETPYISVLLDKIKSYEYKAFVLYKLSNGKMERVTTDKGTALQYKGICIHDSERLISRIHKITLGQETLSLEGMAGVYCVDEDYPIKIFVKINNNVFNVDRQANYNHYTENKDLVYRAEFFAVKLKLDRAIGHYDIKLMIKLDDKLIEMQQLRFENYAPIRGGMKSSYFADNNWIVTVQQNIIRVEQDSLMKSISHEMAFCKELISKGGKANFKAVIVRLLCKSIKPFIMKPIWLVSDRLSRADDNGEAFFKYINSFDSGVVSYFVIDSNCKDYHRLKQYGKVVAAYSWKHKVLSLLAATTISSQTDVVFRHLFYGNFINYMDFLSEVKFVFLQHGIITTDLSNWLCRRKQNISCFITSTKMEYNLIKNGDYNYTEKEIVLTGLPRFDYLEDNRENIITFLPTWRKYLAIGQDSATGIWSLIPNFSSSEYASFYRNLLSNERLLDKARELGYKLQFKIHPSFLSQVKAFQLNSEIHLIEDDVSYRDIYSQSNLIITDYSSSIYDFLYLRKPIIYTQFDKETFFSGEHMGRTSSFDYERDGFGDVEYDLESTVDCIIEYMENGCQIKPKYRERIDRFFAFNDRNNCQRVYKAIKSLE